MAVPKSLGVWQVGKLLGEGAFSAVYSASLDGVYVKEDGEKEWVLKLAKVPPPAKNQKRKSKKQKEAEASSKLLFWEYQVYRNFLRDLDCIPKRPKGRYLYGEENSWRYLALEKLGSTLRAEVDATAEGVLPVSQSFGIAAQVVEGLQRIHQVGIVFRDIKPENFMFGASAATRSKVYFVDFGASCKFILHSGKHLDTGNAPAGTPLYMSIFTHELHPPSRRDDLLSLGYMLCWMLAGALPWANAASDDEVLASKKSFTNQRLCESLPVKAREPVQSFLDYCSGLGVHDTPDYAKLKEYLTVAGQENIAPGKSQPKARATSKRTKKSKEKPKAKAKSRKAGSSNAQPKAEATDATSASFSLESKKRKQVVPVEVCEEAEGDIKEVSVSRK